MRHPEKHSHNVKLITHCVKRTFLFLFEEKVAASGRKLFEIQNMSRRLMTEKVIYIIH